MQRAKNTSWMNYILRNIKSISLVNAVKNYFLPMIYLGDVAAYRFMSDVTEKSKYCCEILKS